MKDMILRRRSLLKALGSASLSVLAGCGDESRYRPEDVANLERQRREEAEQSGKGPFGPQRYRGYRGLAELPWFELDDGGRLRCVDEAVPRAIDMHTHLGIALLFAPSLDLQAERSGSITISTVTGRILAVPSTWTSTSTPTSVRRTCVRCTGAQ